MVMGQAPVSGQLRPRRPWSSAPHFGATLTSDHFFRKNGLLTTVFHVWTRWPRGIKARAARITTETLIYDFGPGLTWLDSEHHRLATVLEYYTHSNLGKRIQDYGGRLCKVHSEANLPDTRHTVSYMGYHPFHVLPLASHARIHAPYPPQILPNGRGASRFFFAQFSATRGQATYQ